MEREEEEVVEVVEGRATVEPPVEWLRGAGVVRADWSGTSAQLIRHPFVLFPARKTRADCSGC